MINLNELLTVLESNLFNELQQYVDDKIISNKDYNKIKTILTLKLSSLILVIDTLPIDLYNEKLRRKIQSNVAALLMDSVTPAKLVTSLNTNLLRQIFKHLQVTSFKVLEAEAQK